MTPTTTKSKISTVGAVLKPTILPNNGSIYGCSLVQQFKFKNKHSVPLYDVTSLSALNQLIGHAKFVNESYGNVYYRGTDDIYDNVLPSFVRHKKNCKAVGLNQLLVNICDDKDLSKLLKFRNYITPSGYTNSKIKRYNKYIAEALLQHYAGYTRFVDVVDNHWVALWMGLQKYHLYGAGKKNCECMKRIVSYADYYEQKVLASSSTFNYNIYEYIILLAMPYGTGRNEYGIVETSELVSVDLRKALPSIFLRPHAQHALVIRKREGNPSSKVPTSFYDLASQVVAIIRIRIDRVTDWLGEGDLVSSDNFFPSPTIDNGYNYLLQRKDLFTAPFGLLKYF